MVTDFSTISIRKAASAVDVSPTLVYHILHDDLHLKPHKYQEWHKLDAHDYEKRVEFAHWFLSRPKEAKYFFICSDEAYFYLTLPINKQNNRMWSDSRPLEGIEMALHDRKVLVWCSISANRIFRPYIFEESVNKDNYLQMLQIFFWPKQLHTAAYQKCYFQQDDVTPHTANIVQEYFRAKFSTKFIDKKMWPPRSPDLNPCDFYL